MLGNLEKKKLTITTEGNKTPIQKQRQKNQERRLSKMPGAVARVIVSAMSKGKAGREVIAHYATKYKMSTSAIKSAAKKMVKNAPKPKKMSRREKMTRTRLGQEV